MRLFSEHGLVRFILGVIGFIWIIALLLVVTNASLSCVDQNGCLRSFCKLEWLRTEYKLLINKNPTVCSYK